MTKEELFGRELAEQVATTAEKLGLAKTLLIAEVAEILVVGGFDAQNVFDIGSDILYPVDPGGKEKRFWVTAISTRAHETLEEALRFLAATPAARKKADQLRESDHERTRGKKKSKPRAKPTKKSR